MTGGRSPWRIAVVVLICFAAAFTVLAASGMRYARADPRGTLLVSEQLLTHGTVSLNGPDAAKDYRFTEVNGRTYYYYFPPGASIVALPAVAIALAMGVDVKGADTALQLLISAFLGGLTVLLLFIVARFFVGFRTSVLLSLVFWAATPLASTNGTALWSHVPAVVFALVALVALLGATMRDRAWCWWPLGLALFMAILSRPTMSLFAAAILGYAVVRSRRTGVYAAVLLGLLLVAFSLGTWVLTGEPLPPYYQPGRLSGGDSLTSLAGVLASPSRGLLVYLPWLPLLALTAWLTRRHWRDQRLLIVANVAWVLALIVVVSRFPLWYGGTSYGPRLLTDALPSLFVVLVATWPTMWPGRWRALLAAWIVLAVLSVAQHTVAGLYNPATGLWNLAEGYDMSLYVNDWRYPQFLHSDDREADRKRTYDLSAPTGVGFRDLPLP